MNSFIILAFLCFSLESKPESTNTKYNMHQLNFNECLNNGLIDNSLSENKSEQELSTIKDKCVLVCNKLGDKLTSLFLCIHSKYFNVCQKMNYIKYGDIFMTIEDFKKEPMILELTFKEYKKRIGTDFKDDIISVLETYYKSKSSLKKKYNKKYLDIQETFKAKITKQEDKSIADVGTSYDTVEGKELKKSKCKVCKVLNYSEIIEFKDFLIENDLSLYNKKLFNALEILQLNINNTLFKLGECCEQVIYELFDEYYKIINRDYPEDSHKLDFFWFNRDTKDHVSILNEKESKNVIYDLLN